MSAPLRMPPGPLLLPPNRVRRMYRGGLLLERFRGSERPQDGWFPEDWVGSVVTSKLDPHLGKSRLTAGGADVTLEELIARDPAGLLGEGHVERLGAHPYLLIKLLDAAVRLGIQAHPSRATAKRLLDSNHGKTEAWIILDTRSIEGETPHILLGFKEGVRAADFDHVVRAQDIRGMEAMLHRFDVRAGEVYFVESGTPHAIGAGVFMIELQEPADLTVYCEATSGSLEDANKHLGLTWAEALQCFDVRGLSREEALRRWKLTPRTVWAADGGDCVESLLLSPPAGEFFRALRWRVRDRVTAGAASYYIAVIVRGRGQVAGEGFTRDVRAGETYFVPASAGTLTWTGAAGTPAGSGDASEPLEIVTCHPPGADASELPVMLPGATFTAAQDRDASA